ncbi:MAG: hypothetical protein IKR26_04400 [Lachnospiraceae bacterium]|nr:hypothetical protein [Lachnospiraceae bacterium]
MEEKRISEQEFDEAVQQVMEDMANDPEFDGTAKFLIPLTGMIFAREMKRILFEKEATNE